MLKKVVIMFLILSMISILPSFSYAEKPSISAKAAILIDANTGEILFEKNMNDKMYPASTTKIMTAILAIENGNLDDKVVVDEKTPYEISGSHIALVPDEVLTLDVLLHALLIESANDSAVVIAKHISGSVDEFAKLMNQKAKEIGAKNTHFTNPHGLHDDLHTTSAYDLALIAKYAFKNEIFREIVSMYKYTIAPTNKQPESRYLKSSNKLIYGTGSGNRINIDGKVVDIKYDGADGIKTGYTQEAQRCLVSTAVSGNQRLIAVVLNAQGNNIWIDTHKLLNYGFDNFDSKQIAFTNEFIKNIDVEYGDKPYVTGIIGQNLFVNIPKGKENDIKREVMIGEKINAPITKGQVIGRIEYKLDDKVIGAANIISTDEINKKAVYEVVNTAIEFTLFKQWWFWLIILLVFWRFIVITKRRKRRNRRSKLKFNYR